MKKFFIPFMLFAILLAGCTPDFNGSRTGNQSQFIMKYSAFNTTDSQKLVLEAGDSINAKIVVDKGSLSIIIQQENKEPIYDSNNISVSNNFDVMIEESGTYTITVAGNKTKGSVSFIVENNK